MSPQFKTFFKFAVSAAFIIVVSIVLDKFGKDPEFFILPALLVFLVFLWRTLSSRKSRIESSGIQTYQSQTAPQTIKEVNRGKQVIISSLTTLVGIIIYGIAGYFVNLMFLFLMMWIRKFNGARGILNLPSFIIILLAFSILVIFIVFFIKWVKAFKRSVEFRNDPVQSKEIQYKIFGDVMIMGLAACFIITFFLFSIFGGLAGHGGIFRY